MRYTVVLGTAREGNHSQKVARLVVDTLTNKGLDVTFVDVKDFLFGKTTAFQVKSDTVKPWAEQVKNSDGIIFVAPEYNRFFPGELKILIDSLYGEYDNKVAGVVSVSRGAFGGSRMVEFLKILLHTVNFKLTKKSVHVSHVQDDINTARLQSDLDELVEEMSQL